MDFSRDLELKRNFTHTPCLFSKELYSPLLPFKSISRSPQLLPSLQEIGISQLMTKDKILPKNSSTNKFIMKLSGIDTGYEQEFAYRYVSSQKKYVLTQVFRQTLFPSTEVRSYLAQQLDISPRSVQIWFQNKRQLWRSKKRITPCAKRGINV